MNQRMMPLFVYGTLRPGEHLYYIIEEAVRWSLPAKTPGAMYHVCSGSDQNPVYPVVDFEGYGMVYGDVLFVDTESAEFRRVDDMEQGAGYSRRWVPVTVDGEFPNPVEALAYHFDGMLGPRIESGVWG